MSEHKCSRCGQNWSVVIGIGRATPGQTVQDKASRVPVTDIYGSVTGHRMKASAHWVNAGAPVQIRKQPDHGEIMWTYTWDCGDHETSIQQPAHDSVTCARCETSRKQDPYADRYGMQFACSCCGGIGGHSISRDPAARQMPACRTAQTAGAA